MHATRPHERFVAAAVSIPTIVASAKCAQALIIDVTGTARTCYMSTTKVSATVATQEPEQFSARAFAASDHESGPCKRH